MGGGIEAGRISARLTRAEQRASALAVVAERERISRDLHDILGHSLTAISIKSELARRLVEADPVRAQEQMAEVVEIARQALGDVRATASAIREIRAATELASARSVLEAAGIEPHLPSAVPTLSNEVSQLFGFVIREAVTNVVRHSDARPARSPSPRSGSR
jgi:two-component system sensor histidine kinase DesK